MVGWGGEMSATPVVPILRLELDTRHGSYRCLPRDDKLLLGEGTCSLTKDETPIEKH